MVPGLQLYYGYCQTALPACSFLSFVYHNLKARRGGRYWYKNKTCSVVAEKNIYVGKNSNIGREFSYLQAAGTIYIGDYVRFGPSVGVMTSNHDFYKQYEHHEKSIVIGNYCWLGRGVNILSGVQLGTRTIVGAGAVVTKSFPEGYCVIAGNPAKIVKYLDKEKFVEYHYNEEYYGYLSQAQFEKYKQKYLNHIKNI